MGRTPGAKNKPKGDATARAQAQADADTSNTVNSKVLKDAVHAWERCEKEKESVREKAREECADYAEEQKGILAKAKERGLPILAIKDLLRRRTSDRKMGRERVDMRAMLEQALGDYAKTPLGKAALEKVAEAGPSAVDKLIGEIAGKVADKVESRQDNKEGGDGDREAIDDQRRDDNANWDMPGQAA